MHGRFDGPLTHKDVINMGLEPGPTDLEVYDEVTEDWYQYEQCLIGWDMEAFTAVNEDQDIKKDNYYPIPVFGGEKGVSVASMPSGANEVAVFINSVEFMSWKQWCSIEVYEASMAIIIWDAKYDDDKILSEIMDDITIPTAVLRVENINGSTLKEEWNKTVNQLMNDWVL